MASTILGSRTDVEMQAGSPDLPASARARRDEVTCGTQLRDTVGTTSGLSDTAEGLSLRTRLAPTQAPLNSDSSDRRVVGVTLFRPSVERRAVGCVEWSRVREAIRQIGIRQKRNAESHHIRRARGDSRISGFTGVAPIDD